MLQDDLAARAQRIRVVAFDVDGVCTDGKLYYGEHGEVLHAFFARDGLGMGIARRAGLILVAVSGRTSTHVEARLRELKVPHVLQGVKKKDEALARVLGELGATWAETAFIGDDINDVPPMKKAGLACCVPDAADDVAAAAHFVTRRPGGRGALRELLEVVLRAQGRWPTSG